MQPIPESHVSLVSQPLGCVITTIAPNGMPQSTAMWFLYEDEKEHYDRLQALRPYFFDEV